MMTSMRRGITFCLLFSMLLFSAVPRVEGGLVGSELLGMTQAERAADIQKLQRLLESEIVGKRLEALGFTAEEIKGKLHSLSDEDLHRFAVEADQLRVAGDSGLGIIVSLLVIAILVVLLLQLTGHRVVIVK